MTTPKDEQLKPSCQCGSPSLRWVHQPPPRECGKVYDVVEDPVEIALLELSEFGWSSLRPDGEYRSQEELSGLLVQAASIARTALVALDTRRALPLTEQEREALAAVDDLTDGSRHDWRKFAHTLAGALRRLTSPDKEK